MAKYRQARINDAVTQALCEAVREIKDPRVASAMVTITGAEVSADLKFAKIYFSALLADKAEVKKGLESAAGFLRRYLASTVNLRITPELSFCEDHAIEHGAHIAKLLREVSASSAGSADVKSGDGEGEDA